MTVPEVCGRRCVPVWQGKFGLRAAPKVVMLARWASSQWRHERASNLAHSPEHSPNNTTHVTPFT